MDNKKLEAVNYLYDAIYWVSSRMEEFKDDDQYLNDVNKTLNEALMQLSDFYDSRELKPDYLIFDSVSDYNNRFRNFK